MNDCGITSRSWNVWVFGLLSMSITSSFGFCWNYLEFLRVCDSITSVLQTFVLLLCSSDVQSGDTSAKCILVTGSLQECQRGGGV